MDVQITEQPKCSKAQGGSGGEPPSKFEKLRRAELKAIKRFLAVLLMRPATWRFLMVHVPEISQQVWLFVKGIYAFITNLF